MFRILCILVCLHDMEASMIFNDILLIIRINAFNSYFAHYIDDLIHSSILSLSPLNGHWFSAVSQTPVRMLWISVLYFAKRRLRTHKRFGNKIQYQQHKYTQTHTQRHMHTRSRNIIAFESTIATLNEMGIPIAKASYIYIYLYLYLWSIDE